MNVNAKAFIFFELKQERRKGMENLSLIIISIATFLNAVLTIATFIGKAKKPVDKAVENKFTDELKPVTSKLDNINDDIKRLDKNQCMNYLVDFIEDVKNGIKKDEIQRKRATEVYDHYINDLHLNTYIHESWEKYVNQK